MDEDECETEVEIAVAYAPLAWSWRSLVHNAFVAASEAASVGADFLEAVATQFGCASEKHRLDAQKIDARAQAADLLSALDDL